jgi:Zn-dependent metalloprotease
MSKVEPFAARGSVHASPAHAPAQPLPATPGLAGPTAPTAPTAPATPVQLVRVTPTPRVEVWDMSSGIEQAVTGAQLLEGTDPDIARAYANAVKVDEFMRTQLGRNGWDDKGSPIRIVVHAPNEDGTPRMNNAYWDGLTKRIYLGDGDGEVFTPLGGALDVLVHEATHAIVDAEVNLRYEGQQGGINESWSDVLATLADPDDWLIGEDVFTPGQPGDSIRDLERPRFGHVSQLPDGSMIEPHDYSGIPSLAAVRVAEGVGREQMGRIWYSALVDHLDSRAGFAGAARATLDAAAELFGPTSTQVSTVLDAWKSVGVDPRWSAPTPS